MVAELRAAARAAGAACLVASADAQLLRGRVNALSDQLDVLTAKLDALRGDVQDGNELGATEELPVHVTQPAESVGTVALDAGSRDALTTATTEASADLHSDLWLIIGIALVLVPVYLLARVVIPRA